MRRRWVRPAHRLPGLHDGAESPAVRNHHHAQAPRAVKKNAGRKGRRLGPYGRKSQAMVIVCPEEPQNPGTYGRKSVGGKCPKCGAPVDPGFGLAFGGFGPYETCSKKKCDWFWKRIAPENE